MTGIVDRSATAHRQTDYRLGELACDRTVGFVDRGITWLVEGREGIVDSGFYAVVGQISSEILAVLDLHDILMPYGTVVEERFDYAGVLDFLFIYGGYFAAQAVFAVEIGELDRQYGGLNRV